MATARRCGRSGWISRPSIPRIQAGAAPAAAIAVYGRMSAGAGEAWAATANENSTMTAPRPLSRVASQTYLATPATRAVAATTTAAPAALSSGRAQAASAEPQATHAVMARATSTRTRARRA
ncbi:hypothetical protein EAO74_04430 [Streptomyces sp. gb1(2016)]|uniref:Uncharacterized protein n=1 Tax=Streptomyces sp. gb1(2016) TaxID=1828321 RepID=A0A652LBP4_9ACTN|nr:hypothetical protein EAO74_04430 [Streptomyces sp. gb1(2016)]